MVRINPGLTWKSNFKYLDLPSASRLELPRRPSEDKITVNTEYRDISLESRFGRRSF